MIKEGRHHLRFCMALYRIQMENGLYFLHEHPYSATSWRDDAVQDILTTPGVKMVRGDMCAFGMWQNTTEGKKLVMKPTGFMTNAEGDSRGIRMQMHGGSWTREATQRQGPQGRGIS